MICALINLAVDIVLRPIKLLDPKFRTYISGHRRWVSKNVVALTTWYIAEHGLRSGWQSATTQVYYVCSYLRTPHRQGRNDDTTAVHVMRWEYHTKRHGLRAFGFFG